MIRRTSVAKRTLIVNGWEIDAVESTESTAGAASGGFIATTARKPIAIVVRYPDGPRVFDLQGREIPAASLSTLVATGGVDLPS